MKTSNNDLKPFIPAWMFEHNLTPHEGWVLAYLWRCRNAETAKCNPSASTIAKSTQLSSRKVFSCLKQLAEKGLIQIESGTRVASNSYTLMNTVHKGYAQYADKGINKILTNNNNLGVHTVHNVVHGVHNLPKDENLGVLRNGDTHARFLKALKPTLSPNAYRDYRVEVLGDGIASVIDIYGGRTRFPIPA